MTSVMERRNLVAGLAMLIVAIFALTGTASARLAHHKRAKGPASEQTGDPHETCVVHALPSSFMDQGEFGAASSVADVVEVECESVYAEKTVTIGDDELYNQCDKKLYWATPSAYDDKTTGPSTTVELDNDGNATVVLFGGPSCAAASTLLAAHLDVAPYTTTVTAFEVLPPRPTPEGVTASPAGKIEGEVNSDVATIVQVEFSPVFAEEPVNINASQLFSRCHIAPKLFFVTMEEDGPRIASEDSEELIGLKLDNDGNAFVVLFGTASCASGPVMIEASLENAPYTTHTTMFEVEPPIPTNEAPTTP
jgi:hypothetical protein